MTEGISFWGSSTMAGVGSGGNPLNARVGAILGVPTFNGGVGGEVSRQIANRYTNARPTHRDSISVLNLGKNNLDEFELVLTDVGNVVAHVNACVYDRTTQTHKRAFVIMGHFANAGMPSGSSARVPLDRLNTAFRDRYPENFLSVRHLATAQCLSELGITSTAADRAAIAVNVVPPSLKSDEYHLNDAGYDALAKLTADFLAAEKMLPANNCLHRFINNTAGRD